MPIDARVLRLCLVTDRGLARGRSLMQIVDAAVRGGVTMVQLREKAATTRAFLEEARALKSLLAPLGVPLIINDRLDIAMAVDADGVHVGQTDLPVDVARRILGPSKIVGLSISDARQILRPEIACADYLGIGPIYQQQTKEDADPPLSVESFRRLRELDRLYGPKPGQPTRPVVLVEDNGPIHTSKLSLAALAARAHWLTVEWLPKYAPELNDIEVVWHDLKAHHLAHQTFADLGALDSAIRQAVDALNHERMALPLANSRISA